MPREGDYEPNQVIPGTVYLVIRLLGSGGMGTVYEVEDTTVGKRYVLKTLHADLRERKELAMRISKEARTLAKLSHANIVEVVTAGATADDMRLPYFVMQKLNGHTLRSILAAKGRLPLETAYGIAIDLLDALEHAHGFGVIHRDVKPENIFIHRNVNGSYVTKLLDFGVMRLLSSEVGQTGHRFVGTLRYAPPEQLLGGAITPRTDLYSAGLVLYEMVAGVGPFGDEPNDREVASAHLEREPPRLSTHLAVPPALDALVASALSKVPEGRPRDAVAFASALRELSRELSELRRANPSLGTLGNVDAVVALVSAPPSMTNLDEMTRADSARSDETWPLGDAANAPAIGPGITPPPANVITAPVVVPSRAASGTLEDAHPPSHAVAAQHTLRMPTLANNGGAQMGQVGQVDRSAATNTMVPLATFREATAGTEHFDIVRGSDGGDDAALAVAPTMPSPQRAVLANSTGAMAGTIRTLSRRPAGLLYVVYGAAALALVATVVIVGATMFRKPASKASQPAVSADPSVTAEATSSSSSAQSAPPIAMPSSSSSSASPISSNTQETTPATTQSANAARTTHPVSPQSVIPKTPEAPSPAIPRPSATTPHPRTHPSSPAQSGVSRKLPGPGF